MENVSVSVQVGILIWGVAMLLITMVICATNRKLWTERTEEKCDELQRQYDDLVKELDKEKQSIVEQSNSIERENIALKSQMRNYKDTIRWYQNILSWYTKIDGDKINGFINEEVHRFNFSDQTD